MEKTNKSSRLKESAKTKKPMGRYRSIDELSEAKMESAKEFITNLDMTLFKKNGHVE